ncbi:MAG: ATP-dependent DNA helicase [bacterium]
MIQGFQVREAQQAMASLVENALQADHAVVIEAGTGVGKTFAYLVPAFLSGGRVIIATGSKTLQDQLYDKDLPLVRKALALNTRTALLKGRANYLCLQRLAMARSEGLFNSRRSLLDLQDVEAWSQKTVHGDLAELTHLTTTTELHAAITSTVDNCLGTECQQYDDCFVVKARRNAQEADIVVVNHHLFFADLALKEEGFGELLPSANAVIFDEAHQLPEIAANFFSEVVSSRQLHEWINDTRLQLRVDTAAIPALNDQLDKLEKTVRELRLAMDVPGQRAPWSRIKTQAGVQTYLQQLLDSNTTLLELLEQITERSKGLQACFLRLQQHHSRLQALQMPQDNRVQWFETYTQSFALISTPLDVADVFQRHRAQFRCAWVFTSATLSVAHSFQHYTQRIGLVDATEKQLDSPFDYWHHALLYAPQGIPVPQQVNFTSAVVDAALPVIEACGGRTFMLFTSYRALQEAAQLLEDELDYPLLVQGQSSQREMIKQFRALGNAVLLGTNSFWEGVDVRGEALSCVIIDKLPFAAPNDPVLEARIQHMREQGQNPFVDYQLPQAVIAFKQGVGRLIRDMHDKGVLMICDPRLVNKPYGKVFMQSLPHMPKTRKLSVVQRFFALQHAPSP